MTVEVHPALVRDALLHAVDLIERDGWAPWPDISRGPRSIHTVIGDAATKFDATTHLWSAMRAATLAVLHSDAAYAERQRTKHKGPRAPRALDEFEEDARCTAVAIAKLLRRAAAHAHPTSEPEDD